MFEPNERIYHKKWETKDNEKAREKVEKILRAKAPLHCRIPLSWAPEVLALVEKWEKQYGIAYNTSNCFDNFIMSFSWRQIKETVSSFFNFFLKKPCQFSDRTMIDYYFTKNIVGPFIILYRKTFGRFLNKYNKPILYIHQVKEKWGRLVVYYDFKGVTLDSSSRDMIEYDIKMVSKKLTEKGVYYNE
jgi:hypothetical protein